MFLTKKHLSRRTLLRGAGVALALPLLESMIPAGTALAQTAATPKSRLGCIYIPHGATMDKWTPAGDGHGLRVLRDPAAARAVPRSALRRQRPGARAGRAVDRRGHRRRREPRARGGRVPERRASGQEDRSLRRRRPSIRSRPQHVGQDTPLPSIELSIEPLNLSCGDAGFTCAYRNTLAWKSATLPLPMENNPQLVFERLFGDGSTDAQRPSARAAGAEPARLRRSARCRRCEKDLPAADRRRLRDYLDEVREIERRVQQVDARCRRRHRAARCAGRHARPTSRSTSS